MDSLQPLLAPIGVLLCLAALLMITMWVNTVLHEAGHAVARLCASRAKVIVFLGSYGNKEKSWRLRIGRLEVWVRKNILRWWGGMCMGDAQISISRRAMVLLAGPFASLVLCTGMLILLYDVGGEGPWAPVACIVCMYAVLSFIFNLIPTNRPSKTADGCLLYNDGKQLAILWNLRNMPAGYFQAATYYNNGEYDKAAAALELLIRNGSRKADVFRLAVNAHVMMKSPDEAQRLRRQMRQAGIRENADDRVTNGLQMIYAGEYEAAIAYIRKTLVKDGFEKMNLNNLGYALTIAGRHDEAIAYLNHAITIDNRLAYAYGNRSFAYLQTGRLNEGKADLDRAVDLDPNPEHGYIHRNLGVYHLYKQDYQAAVKELEKAKEKEPDIPGLDDFLQKGLSLYSGS